MRHLSSLLTVALVIGLAGGVSVEAPSRLGLTLATSAAWACALLAHLRQHPRLQLLSLLVLVACGGWMLGTHAVDRAVHSPLRVLLEQRLGGFAFDPPARGSGDPSVVGSHGRGDEPITIEGRLLADALVTSDTVVLRVAVTRVRVHAVSEVVTGGVSLGVSGEMHRERSAEWRAGRMVRAPVLLRRPARYLNDGLPDQERALARRGVSLVGTIKSAALVELVSHGRWWEEWAASVRARTRTALQRHVRPASEQSSAIATAILIGDRTGLSDDTERRLQEAGTYHVIAISGGNIAVLTGLLLGAMALAGFHGRLATVTAIGALAAYAVIASGGPSVLRATLMAVVYLAVRLIDQRTAAANAISLTAAAILIWNPLQIVDVGFWFTFGATVALVGATGVADRADRAGRAGGAGRAGRVDFIAGARRVMLVVLVGTVSVELALAPIAAFVFERVTLAGLLLNFAALPAMTVVQVGAMGVLAADLARFDTLAGWLGQGVHLACVALVESARLLDYAPWLTWRVPPPHEALLALYYSVLAGAFVAWHFQPNPPGVPALHAASSTLRLQAARVARVAAAGLFLWIISAPDARIRAFGDGRLHLSMLDVGQGDALLVTFPNGRTLLIDTGGVARGDFDIGDRVIGPALRARRLLALDYLAVTHGDADHIGGARSVMRDFAPREVWWGIPVAGHEATAVVRQEAQRQRAAWRTLQRGDRIDIGGVDVRLHHPPPEDWERQRVRNNDSLVLELRFGEVSMLLTGDISREVEEALIPSLDLLPTVVLKVAHHGSATSSAQRFLEVVQPDVALIGIGRGNTYGHPAPYVLGRLHDQGAEVFRTDWDGQIDVVTDGRAVITRTFTGRNHRTR